MSMSLNEIRNVILLFSNPSWKGGTTVSSTVIRNITALSSQLAYSAHFVGNTVTLSNRYAILSNGAISGLLFVPDLRINDACNRETASHVPLNVARQADLPPMNYHLIAIAPWVSGRCAEAYMNAARSTPVRAFLFYQPGSGSALPPPSDAVDWQIDSTADWMGQSSWPVYAVSGMVGEVLMQHLSLYSGNVTEAPFGSNITDRFLADPEDYLRIWTELDVGTSPSGFETWVYFLIILAVFLAVITTTSLLMHFVQAWRRVGLRRRVAAGDVNLEAMGITRLTVPRSHIQQYPLYTYHYEPEAASPPMTPGSPGPARTRSRTLSGDLAKSSAASRAARSATVSELGLSSPFTASTAATDYQPTCEICLEPYENRVTVIRELPCGHIFHPDCIDQFLGANSSLCPVCKASMLPPGYTPRITNAMVRRERAIRRLRGQVEVQEDGDFVGSGGPRGRWAATRNRLFGRNKDKPSLNSIDSTELQETRPVSKPSERQKRRGSRPTEPQSQEPTNTLAEGRMRELAGFEPDCDNTGSTRWQRMRTRIFPGFS
ncbi:hypothetical protein B0J18DRAFT_415491 [Chaetomium sp. MPI-SDFR-AT-0129]|nr:hypothetical protein B0J18DRAFT_415491 [Chaetomium sp. MPI-SDFR-AT-0129]